MDVEFIVTKQKIYIVQARPAMHKKGDPSYFDLDALSPSDASTPVSFTVLVPGTGALKIITDPRKIIIAKTLDQADQMANSFSCQAVLVDTWASSLSHAAVNFMSHGTPCVYLQNMGAVRNKLNAISSKNPLIIDTQRGILFFWENGRVSPKKNIKQGWFEHPIDRTFSLFMDNAPVLPQISHIMPKDTQLIKKMLELKIATQAPVQKVLLMSINERVEKLINLTERRIKTTNYVLSPQNTQALELFKKTYHDLFLEYSAAIERKVSNFELLFYHKMLEALLYQVHTTQKVLAGYTYSYFLNDTFLRQQIQRILKSRNITHIKELDYATLCPTQELSQKWVDFITELDTISAKKSLEFLKQVQVFETLIDDLNHANSLPLWFATTFYQSTIDTVSTYSKTEPPTNKVQAFIETCAQEYTPKTRTFLHNLTSYQQSISSLSAQMHAGFTSVTAAQSRWMAIKNKLIIPLTDSEFIGEFKDAPFAIKMVACDIMNRTIDILDTTIKAVKTSKDIPLAGRIALFKSMLEDFNTVFVTWVTKIMPEEALRYHDRHPLDWYLDAMKSHYTDIVARSVDASMFQRSAHFAVNAAVLGSGTAFSRHYPRTAEDLFMLIHQNALAAVAGTLKSLFSHRTLSDLLYLPPLLETCRKDLESNGKITIAPIGISYTPDEIKISYNIPLRNHSATTQLIYNTIVQECTCAVQFLGEARGRWKEVALFANISPGLSGLKLAQNVQFDEQAGLVSWAWLIEKSNQLPTIIDYLNIMGQSLSFENNLTLDNLYTVYTGSRARDMEIKKILENYEKTFGHSYTAQWLISQLEPQSPEEPHIISL
jgi:phosphohistidine swiveling domain-containing protein